MTTQTHPPMTEMFQQLSDNFSRTIKTGAEFQDQTSRFWKGVFGQGTQDLQTQFDKASGDMLPFGRANVERFQRMFDEQADRTVELLHDTFDFAKVQGPEEVSDEVLKMWRRSFDFLRESNEMFAKANADLFEQFSNLTRGAAKPANGKPAPKPVK